VSARHGVLVLDKPEGWSSARALDPVKRWAGRRTKVGHAGTLDPFATGVLLALVGGATRLSALAMALPKRYAATVRFGVETDTLDPEGTVVAEADPGTEAPEALAATVASFRGEIDQVPPAHSALKVDGRRAYALARAGRPPELPPRRVVVHAIAIASQAWPLVELDVTCGAGTYVRALARDLGRRLGLPASLAALRRTAIGPYRADDGATPDESAAYRLRPAADLATAAGLASVDLTADAARRFVTGGGVTPDPPVPAGRVAVLHAGRLIGLGDVGPDGVLAPKVVLAAARDDPQRDAT